MMISCFGKVTKKSPAYPSQANTISKESPSEGRNDSKKSQTSSSSEREHNFLRAAHNGHFQKVEDAVKSNIDVNSCNSNGLNALHLAAKGGHSQIVQFLIDHGANINAKTRKNNTAIHIASLAGCLEVVKILVAHDANVNEQSQNGFTPLYMAAQENHVEVIKYLLQQGADTNLSTTDNFTPLAVAIQQGHDETVALLLDKASSTATKTSSNDLKLPPLHIATRKNDYHAVLLLLHHQEDVQNALTYASTNGFTALHVAAYYGSDKVGRLLLENGAPVNCTSKNNVTPLHVATKWNREEMVRIFLEFEANVELSTRDGIRPLHCAAREGNLDMCTLLVEKGAVCDSKTKNGLTPLHMVAQGDHEDLVDFFLKQKGTKINDTSLDYMTPLHIASHCNSIRVAQRLLKRGAHINQRALNGFVGLHIAAKQDHLEFVTMLLSNKCVIDTQTEMGFTALHIASVKGSVHMVQLLLSSECEADIVDQHGRTALHLATIFDHHDIVTCLLQAKVDIDKATNDGQTALMLAIKRVNRTLTRYLIDEGADLSKSDTMGLSALHWAVLLVRENMVLEVKESMETYNELISSCGEIDVNRCTSKGVSSLHLAAECGNLSLVRSLIDNGAKVNTKTSDGATALHFASKNNHSDVVLLLLESMSDDDIRTCSTINLWTPMHFAVYFGSCDALKALISYAKENGDLVDRLQDKTEQSNSCLHLAVQQIRPDLVEILLNNSVDIYAKNKNGISAINLASFIGDEEISGMIGLENLDTEILDNRKSSPLKREEAPECEHLETLLMNSLNELEFFGVTMNNVEKAEVQRTVNDLLSYSTASESIRRTDWSLKLNDSLNRYRHITLPENKRTQLFIQAPPSSMFSTLSSNMSEIDAFDVEKCDHQRITDHPINSGFLVSFLVDARGGYMQAQRLPQLKIFVPPDAAPSPTRIICHLLKPDRLSSLPELNDSDGFASRILQVHSSCPRFQKPIIIEVPHIASLRNGEREIVIMRKNYDNQNWKEHTASANKDNLKEIFGEFYDSLTPEDELESHRISRIVTTEIPNYFCLVSRFQRDSCLIGQEGGSIDSKIDSRIKIKFPPGALMKKIQISLEVQCVDPAVISQVLGDQHQVTVSPIITVEPKRRKFRDLIEIQMPLPKGVDKSDLSNLKILFSISEFVTKWEDVTSSTELLMQDDFVSHSTKISARVWLISAPGIEDVSELANRIYAQHCCTPYIGRFLAFARRHDAEECQLRLIVITDDSADKTLECQESFQLIATGPDVEIINKLEYQIETAGNLVPVTKSDETIQFPVQPFLENRLTVPLRMRNQEEPFSGKIAFIPDFKSKVKQVVRPITTLDVLIPSGIVDMFGSLRKPENKTRVKNATIERIKGCQAIAKTELDLQAVAERVGGDWPRLANELGLESSDVTLVLNESCTDEDKAFMTLIQWQNQFGNQATGNELNRALRAIGREDVVKSCMGDISFVEDEHEAQSARERLKDDVKSYHDDGWDGIMETGPTPTAYSESVNDSMIAETGDDWSDRNRDEDKELSDASDEKSLVGEISPVREADEPEVQYVVQVNPRPAPADNPPVDKTAAFMDLIAELDRVIPEPTLSTMEQDYERQDVHEGAVIKNGKHEELKVEVEAGLSLLNLINCQVNEKEVSLDTVLDLDDFFSDPQETDEDSFSEGDLSAYRDFQNDDQCVIEVNIPGEKAPVSPSNYEGFEITNSLLSMQNDEMSIDGENQMSKRSFKRRRNTEGKAKFLEHDEKFQFHPPAFCLRRCYSVDIPRRIGRLSFPNTESKSVAKDVEDSSSDEDWNLDTREDKNYPEVVIEETEEKEDSDLDNMLDKCENTKTKEEEWLDITRESPVTDLDDISYSDDNEDGLELAEEQPIHHQLDMSFMPANMDLDLDDSHEEVIIPVKSPVSYQSKPSPEVIVEYREITEPIELKSCMPISTDIDFEETIEETDVRLDEGPLSYNDSENETEARESVTAPELSASNLEKHSVLHEVFESDPQTQTEVEEQVEVMPDGSIVTRKIIKKQVLHTITEKTTREISPEEEEQLRALRRDEPAEVVETEVELEDGSVLRRTVTTTKTSSITTSKSMSECDPDPGALVESVELDPPADLTTDVGKPKKSKRKKKLSKSGQK